VAYDGAGRVRYQGGDHPDAVGGKYSMQMFEYDEIGRRTWARAAMETNGYLTPTGDDASAYRWTKTTYDALDRPTQILHPDNNTIEYSYVGCGCAGGETVTLRDEREKYRRTTSDFLGRLYEASELNTSQGVYNRARYTYDERDLLQSILHYDNGSSNY
jgi:YD repeat-containing protein